MKACIETWNDPEWVECSLHFHGPALSAPTSISLTSPIITVSIAFLIWGTQALVFFEHTSHTSVCFLLVGMLFPGTCIACSLAFFMSLLKYRLLNKSLPDHPVLNYVLFSLCPNLTHPCIIFLHSSYHHLTSFFTSSSCLLFFSFLMELTFHKRHFCIPAAVRIVPGT